MAQDITSSIDRTGLTGADPTVDKADMLNAVNDLITVINSILNGGQSFDQINFATAEALTIATGAITVSQTLATVDTEASASTDDLDTITGTAGDVLYLKAANTARTVVLKHGTDNIITYDGSDISLDDTNKTAHLVRFGSSWYVMAVGVTTFDAASVTYTPTTAADWDSDTDPGNVDDALDQLAAARTAIAILRDEKTTGTDGGSSSATTWNNRNLNTEVYDNKSIVSISSNQFTPIAGEYKIYAAAPAREAGAHRLRLYNVTGTASVDEGQNAASLITGGMVVQNNAILNTAFTANGTDAYRIDHYTTSAKATTGLGAAVSDGTNEVYLEIVLEKIG